MAKVKDMLIEKYEPKVSELAQITGYAFETLWEIWMECLMDRSEISEEENWSYFRGVTLELDW